MTLPADWIVPDWPAPACVRAFVTTREGGVSEGEHGSLNLGARCGDDPARVAANREWVRRHLPSEPRWLDQVHGNAVADLDAGAEGGLPVENVSALLADADGGLWVGTSGGGLARLCEGRWQRAAPRSGPAEDQPGRIDEV